MENNKSRLINNTRNVIPVFVGHLNKAHETSIKRTSVYLCSTIEVPNLLMFHKQSSNSNKFWCQSCRSMDHETSLDGSTDLRTCFNLFLSSTISQNKKAGIVIQMVFPTIHSR